MTMEQFLIPNGKQRTRETNLQNRNKNVPIDGFSPPAKSEECRIFLEEKGALGDGLECEATARDKPTLERDRSKEQEMVHIPFSFLPCCTLLIIDCVARGQ